MKKLLLFTCISFMALTCTCQTGIGWKQITTKQNFAADVNFAKAVKIGGITITPTAIEINILHGRMATGTELDYVHLVTSPIQAQINLKAPLANPTFSGYVKIGTDTAATRAYARSYGGGEGSKGSVAWGDITETLSNQTDLQTALNLKANLNSPAFTGTPSGITAAMVGAIPTSHAAYGVTGTYITNWNSAYSWGNHASAGYALSSTLSNYVPLTRTVNGHALSSNVSVTTTDLSLNNVNNTSDANKPVSTATQTALNLKANIANPSFTTGITTPAITLVSTPVTATAAEINIMHGVTASASDINNIKGVTASPDEINILDGVELILKNYREVVSITYTAAGDTSNFPVPLKFGDFYFDSSADELYFAKTAARDGWLKLN